MFKRYTAFLVTVAITLASGAVGSAQGPQEKFDQAAVEKIKEEGMTRSQVMDILSYLTDVPGSRLTGSPGLKSAQEWAKQKLAAWGLQNALLEAWGPFGRGWSLEGFSANLVKPNYAPLIGYPKAWSPSTSGVLRAQPVYFEAKTEADLEKYKGKLKGAIVLLSAPREVKAQFQPLSKRQSDEELLQLATADPPSPGGQGGGRNFRMTDEQRAAQALQTKKWLTCFKAKAPGWCLNRDGATAEHCSFSLQLLRIPRAFLATNKKQFATRMLRRSSRRWYWPSNTTTAWSE